MTADKFAAERTSVRRCPRPQADEEPQQLESNQAQKAYQQFEFTYLRHIFSSAEKTVAFWAETIYA
jgi:hypothetical protein